MQTVFALVNQRDHQLSEQMAEVLLTGSTTGYELHASPKSRVPRD